MAVPQGNLTGGIGWANPQKFQSVILSDPRESKDLRTKPTAPVTKMRRSFDALRLLRMTSLLHGTDSPEQHLYHRLYRGTVITVPYITMVHGANIGERQWYI